MIRMSLTALATSLLIVGLPAQAQPSVPNSSQTAEQRPAPSLTSENSRAEVKAQRTNDGAESAETPKMDKTGKKSRAEVKPSRANDGSESAEKPVIPAPEKSGMHKKKEMQKEMQ